MANAREPVGVGRGEKKNETETRARAKTLLKVIEYLTWVAWASPATATLTSPIMAATHSLSVIPFISPFWEAGVSLDLENTSIACLEAFPRFCLPGVSFTCGVHARFPGTQQRHAGGGREVVDATITQLHTINK